MFLAARPFVCTPSEESRTIGGAAGSAVLSELPGQPELARQGHVGDAALAQRAVAGVRAAQRELFRQLKGALHATLYRVLGSNAHMEELLQKTFMGVFRALPFYRGEDPLTLWADRIALRVARQHLREQRRPDGEEAPEPGPALRLVTSGDDAAQHRRGVAQLYAQLRRLEPENQITFALLELDARPLVQVAELTGVSTTQALQRLSHARAQLWAAARRDDALAQCLREQQAGQR
jgi:RNA polymerase sigma-70 factor (ECF subfamily)